MISQEQIEHIRQSWAQVLPIRYEAGSLFYQRLFEIAPELRVHFPEDMGPQAGKLMGMLGMVVASLDKLDEFLPQIRALAQRHNAYGTQPQHYQAVGEALLWTLQQGLVEAWTQPVQEAWQAAYTTLSTVMIDAQAEQPIKP